MLPCFVKKQTTKAIPITILPLSEYSAWLMGQDKQTKNWLKTTQFRIESGSVALIPDSTGHLSQVVCCVSDLHFYWGVGSLPFILPEGEYRFILDNNLYSHFAIAWGLGAYQFLRYKKANRKPATLVLNQECDSSHINNMVESIYMVRDLINTPTDDMGPTELANAAFVLSQQYNAEFNQIIGEDLLKYNFHSIYTVGRASDDPPRFIDFRWGNKNHRKITLVGKGVCFDSGGLDIKPSTAMLLMKKDMAGAAHVLGLARMIMEARLPIYLRVLIPAVENVISGNAYRPGDIIKSRKGITIEIGNTDAEGRVILADALTDAVSEKPDLVIDITTLTGAARIALGTELPAVFSNKDDIVNNVIQHANRIGEPIWRLPLFSDYRESLNSPIADINNAGSDSYGGAITAALFLQEFVPNDVPWLHYDMMAWNLKARPGRPIGGEAMALRGLYHYLAG